jgi:hypothetical protein
MRSISVAELMIFVLLSAIGAAALSSGSESWSSAVHTLSLAALGFAIVGAMLRRGRARAFWLGFALFGCGYSYFAYDFEDGARAPYALRQFRTADSATPRPRLASSLLLDLLYDHVSKPVLPAVGSDIQVQWGGPHTFYPAAVTKLDAGRVQILWKGYAAGQEEWVATSRIQGLPAFHFHATGHSLLTLAVAMIGGIATRAAFGGPAVAVVSEPMAVDRTQGD